MNPAGARPVRVVLLGPPASGKGTQGRRVADRLGLAYLSTGALLREHVENGTALGRQAKPILDRGEYLPDGLMCGIIGAWLDARSGGWVLDGFPRSLPQAEYLARRLEEKGAVLDGALYLDVPFDELLGRIRSRVECPECRWSGRKAQAAGGGNCPECGAVVGSREDDTEENFRSRHQQFVEITMPAVEWYRSHGKLIPVDASRAVDDVTAALLEGLHLPGR